MLGTENIARIKIGIGRDDQYEVSDWVLSKFSKKEVEALENIFADEFLEKVDIFLGKTKS